MARSSFRMCRNRTRRASQAIRAAAVLALAFAAKAPTKGASLTFEPDDPIVVVRDLHDASSVKRREITHFHDAWNAIWRVGDGTARRAMDVNSVDEVPDSSWFENRIATRSMSPAEIANGPNRGGPAPGRWTVTSGKTEGATPGLQMKDSGGQLYFVKFDPPGYAELGSGAEVISTKLLYAAGYHVPENDVAVFGREDLRLAPGATIRERDGTKRPMTASDLDAVLRNAARGSDGRYRALVSKALPGTPLGPFSYYGTRADDPNDTIPHEHRRALRGLRVLAAWINHVDVKSENSLDTLVPGDAGVQIVRHNLLDFNATLGSAGIGPAPRRSGYEYIVDTRPILASLLTLGVYVRPWMTVRYPDIPSVGRFEGDRFDPQRWKPTFPNRAMLNARPDDLFWAARRVTAFSDQAIRAVVERAQYSDRRATQTIVNALIKRRDKIGREWLTGVNPLIDFFIDDTATLIFSNAAVAAGIATPAAAYHVQWFRFDNANGTIARVGPPVATTTPRVSVPPDLSHDAEFIGADVAAGRAQYPAWQRPVRVFFRRLQIGWQLVGLERLPDTTQ